MSKEKTYNPPATAESPDHSTCRNCGVPIDWDETCYTHSDTGFADCGVSFGPGTGSGAAGVLIDPQINRDPNLETRAEPVEWR